MTDIATETQLDRIVRLALALGRQNRIVSQVRALLDLGRPVSRDELEAALTWRTPQTPEDT